jgi:hypothetical protein
MIGVENPGAGAVTEIFAATPRRVDLIASSTVFSEPDWVFTAPGNTSISLVTDYDSAPSIRMSDSTSMDRPSIASSVSEDLWNDMWNNGGRLIFRFGSTLAVAGDCCTVGFGAPVNASRGWVPAGSSYTPYVGCAVTIKRTTTGFDFYWFNADTVKIGSVTASTSQTIELLLRMNPLSSRIELFAGSVLVASLNNWQYIDEFFTGVIGVHTRPATLVTQPVNIRRLMLMAFSDSGTVIIPTVQASTRVILPSDPRAWVIRVPDDFPRNATIEVVNHGCVSVTFAPVNKALFNGTATALHTRPSTSVLRLTACQVGGDPGNWWVTGT